MALCNIVGDLCYLGFAFEAQGFVSLPKLSGALFTLAAHAALLAYGDDQARHIACEEGVIPRVMQRLRFLAQSALRAMPKTLQDFVRSKPIGVPFAMLSLNGVGLVTDALLSPLSLAMSVQVFLGICITAGCGAFALADFATKQKTANILLKIAPTILVGASVANAGLAMTTCNGFVILSVFVFLLSNLAGFYTKIEKKKPVFAEL